MESELIEIRDLEDRIFPIAANEVGIMLLEDAGLKAGGAEAISKTHD